MTFGDGGKRVASNVTEGVTLFLLLCYTVVALILDYTYPIPKHDWLTDTMTAGYWLDIFLFMFLLAYFAFPEVFTEQKDFMERHRKRILWFGAFITATMLAINIRAGGDIRSPYVGFLSSFPIVSMVLLFDTVTLRSCAKGAGIVAGCLSLIYAVDFFLLRSVAFQGIPVEEGRLGAFLGSSEAARLAMLVVVITAVSNLVSIYIGSRKG